MSTTTTPINWLFTTQTTAKGLTYLRAYTMKHNTELHKSKRDLQRHVGRVMPDGRVVISPNFVKDNPMYAGDGWYIGPSNHPIRRDEFNDLVANSVGEPPKDEDSEILSNVEVGRTWAAIEYAKSSQVLDQLKEIFGDRLGEQLLYLAIYKLCDGESMMSYDLWRQTVWLPKKYTMSSQRISEILAQVTREKVTQYFKKRHDRKVALWDAFIKAKPDYKGVPLEYALDNTSISTYSETIPEAQYGHAKRDDHLKQINYTLVCDQRTGDIMFSYYYEGSVNDVTALKDILMEMKSAGFDLSKNLLVTDRGYSSIHNVQKMIDLKISYLQGVRSIENSITKKFEEQKAHLSDPANFLPEFGEFSYSYTESWKDEIGIAVEPHVHLYFDPLKQAHALRLITKNAKEIIDLKNKNLSVSASLWDNYHQYVQEVENADGRREWTIKHDKVREGIEKCGRFVIRSNKIGNAEEAMRIYKQRNIVEMDFNMLKNWLDCDRLRVGPRSLQGKLLVCTIAAALRMMMMTAAKRNETSTKKIPENSIAQLLKTLALVRADKRTNANAWIRQSLPASRRHCYDLLGLSEPPRSFR